MDDALRSLRLSFDIRRAIEQDNDGIISSALHCEGWLRSEGLLTPAAYRIIDEHIWGFVDAAGAPASPMPCGWNWDSITRSSRGAREQIAQYLRAAVRHHVLWRPAKILRH